MSSQIRLKSEGFQGGHLHPEHRVRCTWLRLFKDNVRPTTHQHVVDSLDAVGRGVDLCKVDRLHDAWAGQQQGRVDNSSGGGDDLATTSENGLVCKVALQDLELDTLDWLLTKRALSGRPLKALHNRRFNRSQCHLIRLLWQRIINEHV